MSPFHIVRSRLMATPLPANRDWYVLYSENLVLNKQENLVVGIPKDRRGMLRDGFFPVSIGYDTSDGCKITYASPRFNWRFGDLCNLVDNKVKHINPATDPDMDESVLAIAMTTYASLLKPVSEESISVPSY